MTINLPVQVWTTHSFVEFWSLQFSNDFVLLRSCVTHLLSRQWEKSAVVVDGAVWMRLPPCYTYYPFASTTHPPYWRRSSSPSKSSSSPLSWNLLEPRSKISNPEGPCVTPVEAQLTGAQLVQKREIIRESSRRSKASTGWRRKSTLQNNGCWFKNLSVCFRRTMPDPVEHMIAPSVSAASENLTPSTPSTQRCCLTLGVQSAAVVLPFHFLFLL